MKTNNYEIIKTNRSLSDDGDIIYGAVPVNTEESKGLTIEQKTQILTDGAKIINRVMDIIHLQEQTDSTLKIMDKEIELIERTTQAEISKMMAQTDSWEKRFEMVSKVLREMTITVTTNKDLHPEIAKSLIDTVKTMVEKISVGD